MTLIERFSLLALLLPFVLIIGWVMNLVTFIKKDSQEPYKAEVIRGISIVIPPISGVAGI